MPRGGARVGAGRKPDPNSARAKKAAARAAKAFVAADGIKTADAPKDWPFGTEPAPAPTAAPAVTPVVVMEPEEGLDALKFFQRIYRDPQQDPKARFAAAIQAIPFEIAKPGVTGKKAAKDEAAKKAHSRFAPSAPPKLAAVAGRKV